MFVISSKMYYNSPVQETCFLSMLTEVVNSILSEVGTFKVSTSFKKGNSVEL